MSGRRIEDKLAWWQIASQAIMLLVAVAAVVAVFWLVGEHCSGGECDYRPSFSSDQEYDRQLMNGNGP